MRNILGCSLWVGVFFLLLSSTDCSATSEKHYRVMRVIDGDTIQLEDRRMVRYIGIDTPEVRFRENGRWVYRPQNFALEAHQMNETWVGAKSVRLELDVVEKDRYGRTLAYVFVDDVMVNEMMLKDGLAQLLTIPPNIKYSGRFKKAQREARDAHKGMWRKKNF